jgi:hypothetical protein
VSKAMKGGMARRNKTGCRLPVPVRKRKNPRRCGRGFGLRVALTPRTIFPAIQTCAAAASFALLRARCRALMARSTALRK